MDTGYSEPADDLDFDCEGSEGLKIVYRRAYRIAVERRRLMAQASLIAGRPPPEDRFESSVRLAVLAEVVKEWESGNGGQRREIGGEPLVRAALWAGVEDAMDGKRPRV